ncbi:MAG TPA: lipocalin-like domain-containing protein [Thermoanaerobaculia bacterium]|jgi:predicted secreted hydrolase|nr:lipocalin-like domain-containing protein [Thermoanaerobaculia bacterium]
MRKAKRVLAVLLLLASAARGADRAGKDGFLLALPGYELAFPRDHGSHDGYRTEWWYYTGHLTAEDGRRYGFEVTFFRVGVSTAPIGNRWDLRHVALAHFALTDISAGKFRYYEKLSRDSPFTAQAASGHLDVFNEGWRAWTAPDGSWRLTAAAGSDAVDLTLVTSKPPAVHGENGISIKAPVEGYASHYYSMTRLEVTGTVNGRRCRGLAWMDHEFGSSALREGQQGWDWYAIQLDNETELMLYVIRRADGTPDLTSSGSLITSEGEVVPLKHDQMKIEALSRWRSPRSGATYPMGWRVMLPRLGILLTLDPLLRDQELITKGSTGVTYWEGAVDISGQFNGIAVKGDGYVEMTGYDRPFRSP